MNISWTTVWSVIVALVAWDVVMYSTLGTSPVLGSIAGPMAGDTANGGNSNQNTV